MKSITPRRLSLIIAAIITGLVVVVMLSVLLAFGSPDYFYWMLGGVALVFPLSYVTVLYFIRLYLENKIRIIYKTIHQQKLQGQDINVDMDADVLAGMESEVVDWAQNHESEIEQLKAQEQFRREFIGNLGHELKTPVFSIQGYILTLLEGGLDDPEVNRKFLQRAASGVDRMTHILEDLDTITQFESNKLSVEFRTINVVDVARDVLEGLEMKASKRNLDVRFNEEYDRPILVECDSGRISQVFTNLINNAINYGTDGGKVEVRFFDLDKHILVEVADNGIGIAERHLPRLFERFYRIDKSRSRHEGGTGLGLAIVKHIIDAHQQTINVRSTEGVGSTFSFTLKKAQ